MEKINIKQKFEKFSEIYTPKIIAQMNDYHFKLARLKGDFTWHSHSETDEVFIVIEGNLDIHFRDRIITLNEGEMLVIPEGVEHKPYAENECQILLIEKSGTLNTGNIENDQTINSPEWI